MFKNLKETRHEVTHKVNISFDREYTKHLLKCIGAIVIINGVAHVVNTVVDHKLNNI